MHFRKFCNFLAGSFSAVSKRNFATKYAFDSIFQSLQDLYTSAPLQSQNLAEIGLKNQHFFLLKFHKNCCFFKPIFCENFEIAAVQKHANLLELEKCCRTHILLQNFVLIQLRTSPPKICKNTRFAIAVLCCCTALS